MLHPLAVAGTVLSGWNQLAGYSQLLGRLVSVLGIPSHLKHIARLRARAEEREDPAVELASDDPADTPDAATRPAQLDPRGRSRRAA
jgi:hypothetical protein